MTGRVLILGASGRFGRNAAEAFWNAGWRVHLFDRTNDDLMLAAEGMDVIVHGWNPAYTDWAAQTPGLTARVIAAAKASGATILVPGNVYVFGADAPAEFGPGVPHAATNPLGRVRIAMEESLRASGVQVIILRAGDFLDTEASGNWFDKQIAPSLRRGVLTWPGDPDADHAWAFLPDMARAAVQLADHRRDLPRVSDINFPGYTLTGWDLALACARALNRPVKLRRMSWLPLWLARPFWTMAAPLLEMRYLWSKPHRLTRDSFDTVLPDFQETPLDDAIARALAPVIGATPDRPRPTHAGPRQPQAQ
ncbi:NAD-dependent epimerase/dehydratase family protein [Sagittula sp. MA-2]|jgi:nucleoside-diphosphate-sugar epimerase|uniref:NAD-dependent epimerase/dehydratase family protein n=1 Tax=Sagittula sp. MA-2 TaxID=3048007 RepID=UPI0024C3C97D|nr:NAD-dependent epimerase/dehydratase family protein [Sagittula sp. MA-2]WHZ35058.1 sugar nucleotide-binding protein [Sagittula sp. MA-2]